MVYVSLHVVGQQDILKIMAELKLDVSLFTSQKDVKNRIHVTYITNSTVVSLLIRQHKSGGERGWEFSKTFRALHVHVGLYNAARRSLVFNALFLDF